MFSIGILHPKMVDCLTFCPHNESQWVEHIYIVLTKTVETFVKIFASCFAKEKSQSHRFDDIRVIRLQLFLLLILLCGLHLNK